MCRDGLGDTQRTAGFQKVQFLQALKGCGHGMLLPAWSVLSLRCVHRMLLPAWNILSLRCGPQGRGPRHLLKPEPQHIPGRTPRYSQVSSSLCTRSLGPLPAPLTTPHPRGSRMHLLGDTFRLQNLGSFSHLVLYMLSPYWCQGSQGKERPHPLPSPSFSSCFLQAHLFAVTVTTATTQSN